MEAELFKWLSAGGDVGVYLILLGLWKIERRLFKLENEKSFVNEFTTALTNFAHTVKMRGN